MASVFGFAFVLAPLTSPVAGVGVVDEAVLEVVLVLVVDLVVVPEVVVALVVPPAVGIGVGDGGVGGSGGSGGSTTTASAFTNLKLSRFISSGSLLTMTNLVIFAQLAAVPTAVQLVLAVTDSCQALEDNTNVFL